MKKILVIDESPLFRKYLEGKLKEYKFEVILGINGLDGMVKIRSNTPDLIIMDYYLSRKSSIEVLQEKDDNANTKGIPVIIASNKIDKSLILEVARYNVKKFLAKPLKIDALCNAVSELLGVELEVDSTPCIIEAHFNDEILFIEIARGLNREKIELLKYKITELLQLYEKKIPKVLIIMSDIKPGAADADKLDALFINILETTRSPDRAVKILTSNEFIKQFIAEHKDFNKIEVTDNMSNAMDAFLGVKVSDFVVDGKIVLASDLLTSSTQTELKEGSIDLRYASEQKAVSAPSDQGMISIAAVDDDLVIRELINTAFSETGWKVQTFENGKTFTESLEDSVFDLLFLDLMMPEMDGFQVLEYLKDRSVGFPVIVLSALTEKEAVVKAVSLGVKSYLIKPLKPADILKKTREFLKMNF